MGWFIPQSRPHLQKWRITMQNEVNAECETRFVPQISLFWKNWNLFKKACGYVIAISMTLAIAVSSQGQMIGSGPGFEQPVAIAVEADGSLVVADFTLEAVVRVDPVSGDRTILSDASTGSGPGFGSPVGLLALR